MSAAAQTAREDGDEETTTGEDGVERTDEAAVGARDHPDVEAAYSALWLAVGVGLVVVALALYLAPGLAVPLALEYPHAVIVGLLAVVQFVRLTYSRYRSDVTAARPPAVERRLGVSVTGAKFDALLGKAETRALVDWARYRREVRDRLSAAAVSTLQRARGYSESEAADRLSDGTWTDSALAASVFDASGSTGLADRVAARLGGRSPYRRRVEAVLSELAALLSLVEDREDPVERPDDETGVAPDPAECPVDSRTMRWHGLSVLALVAVATAVFAGQPGLLLAAGLLALFAAYASFGSPPAVDLAVERAVSATDPDPGETVTVEVTVTNAGEDLLSDLRLVDGVPPGLTVASGSPRHGTALRPGDSTSFTYRVRATHGRHEFQPLMAVARDASGATERTTRVAASEDPTLTAQVPMPESDPFPLRPQTSQFVGRVTTDQGGSGVEFHSVREYQSGDPLSRIDWNRAARTGELATLEFREEKAANVVLVVDARREAYVTPSLHAPPAVDRSVAGAAQVFRSLLDADDRVGFSAVSPTDCWLPPGAGHSHRARARELLSTHRSLDPRPPSEPFYPLVQMRAFRRRLPSDAQLVVFAPLVDDFVVAMARRLTAYGHLLTVVSPDPTGGDDPAQVLERIERFERLSRLRRAGVRVVDWGYDESLTAAVDRAQRRWSG